MTVEIGQGKAIELELSIVTDVYNIYLDVGVGYTGEGGVRFPRICGRNYYIHQRCHLQGHILCCRISRF